jgi:hypothetical protein
MIGMTNTNSPYTRDELLASLAWANQEIAASFGRIPAQRFFAVSDGWSPAETLVHVIKSNSPVGKAMKLPSLLTKLEVGTSQLLPNDMKSESLSTNRQGAQAMGGSSPRWTRLRRTAAGKRDILAKWSEVADRLVKALADWTDADLDYYSLPHPLIGQLTVREMLLFTQYHNLRHLNEVRIVLGESSIPA